MFTFHKNESPQIKFGVKLQSSKVVFCDLWVVWVVSFGGYGMVWASFGILLGWFRDDFWDDCGMVWVTFGSLLASFGSHLRYIWLLGNTIFPNLSLHYGLFIFYSYLFVYIILYICTYVDLYFPRRVVSTAKYLNARRAAARSSRRAPGGNDETT